MAASLLLPVVGRVAGKAADALVELVARMWGIDSERQKLERQLLAVQCLLVDAEAKGETNAAIKRWMKDLGMVACKAEDVLDGFHYEALRRQAQAAESTPSKVIAYINIPSSPLWFRLRASWELRSVLQRISYLVKEMKTFGLVERTELQQVVHRPTHSALDDSAEIFGREVDKEVVVKTLLDQRDEHNVQVLPIVGMGGLGKTTLAKMVYNHSSVEKHFDLKMWHCVSEATLDACAIVKSIIELATKGRCDLPDIIQLLKERLWQVVGRKRYLLILDDVWNEEQTKWENDLKPLLCSSIAGSGSIIVVTSRSQRVASIMGTLPPYQLACLGEYDSWRLFSNKAFSKGVQEQAELVRTGKRIVNKCKGLPLALNTMGGLMSSKQVHEWEAIAESNLGDTIRGKDEILSILKLSYMHLPYEMKQCFAFCAVFPKDHKIEKDMLIQLWTANGFIQGEGTMDLEEKGEFIFNYLVWRSFLQHANIVKASRYWHGLKQESNGCKMHDLMHDLAKDVASECATAQELIQKKVSIKDTRHLKLSSTDGWREIRGLFKGTIPLRTLLVPSMSYQDLRELKLGSLRALWCYCHDPSIIRSNFINTAHLKYLDLSWSSIVRLPSSICMLHHLESLRLSNCYKLRYLPEGMTSMKKLRHIYLLQCDNLERMPSKLSLLHNLRTLTMFIVEAQDGNGIDELKDMQQLSNRLELYNLKEVKCGSKANLHEKRNLRELLLYWDRRGSANHKIHGVNNEEQVLESLVPCAGIEILEIDGYGGHEISQWMRDPQIFQRLRELIISDCPSCKDLPVVWLSPSLEHLSLSNMFSLTTLCKNINVEAEGCSASLHIFPKLKRMELSSLPELERWVENSTLEPNSAVIFPQLEELRIHSCLKLATLPASPVLTHLSCISYSEDSPVSISMPLYSWPSLATLEMGVLANMVFLLEGQQSQSSGPLETLRSLGVQGDNGFISLFVLPIVHLGLYGCFALVQELVILSCSSIVRWPLEELRCLARLRYLKISHCAHLGWEGSSSDEILPLPQLERLLIEYCDGLMEIPRLPVSLEELDIAHCRSLVALPTDLGNLSKLRELYVVDCDLLKALPEGMDGLTSLESVTIKECAKVSTFPDGLLQRIPNLKSIIISGCPDLQRRCCGKEYFSLISSVPRRSIQAIKPISRIQYNNRRLA